MPSLFEEPAAPARHSTPWVHAHCDGGARGNPGPAGYGAILADEQGHTLAELSEFLGNRTNNFAEYSGLLGVLAWTLEHGYRRLRVVSDSELMVKQIQGKYKVNSPDLRPLWEEARQRIRQLDGFEITHALRHKNKRADQLANDAMDRGTGRAPATSKPAAAAVAPRSTATPASQPATSPTSQPREAKPREAKPREAQMLRGFTRDGVVHILGGATLPDGVFVKIVIE